MHESEVIDAAEPSETVVLVVRAWYQHDRLVARLILEPTAGEQASSIVVGSLDQLCRVIASTLSNLLPRLDGR